MGLFTLGAAFATAFLPRTGLGIGAAGRIGLGIPIHLAFSVIALVDIRITAYNLLGVLHSDFFEHGLLLDKFLSQSTCAHESLTIHDRREKRMGSVIINQMPSVSQNAMVITINYLPSTNYLYAADPSLRAMVYRDMFLWL
jgi:hypothetical protein